MKTPTPRTDPRILRTRQLIKDALVDLMLEMDMEKITVNKIAERATINRVTFYLHYRDIPDMLEKIADEMMVNINQILTQSRQSGSRPDSREKEELEILVTLLEHFAAEAKFYKVMLAYRRSPVITDRLQPALVGIIKGKIDDSSQQSSFAKAGVPREIEVWYGAAAFLGTIGAWLRMDMPYTPRYMAQQIVILLPNYFR